MVSFTAGNTKTPLSAPCSFETIPQSDIKGESPRYNVLPEPDDEIKVGDILVVVGAEKDIERFASSM